MLVPLRNAVMFDPETVINDETEWNKLTKVFTDCSIKLEAGA